MATIISFTPNIANYPIIKNNEIANEIRHAHGTNTLVLYKDGQTYESYGTSAEIIHDICRTSLTYTGDIATIDFPSKALDIYIPKLIVKGYKIVILDK